MVNLKNRVIKEEIKKSKLFQWQVAEVIGITESAFSRKMRYELLDDDKKLVLEAIQILNERKILK